MLVEVAITLLFQFVKVNRPEGRFENFTVLRTAPIEFPVLSKIIMPFIFGGWMEEHPLENIKSFLKKYINVLTMVGYT